MKRKCVFLFFLVIALKSYSQEKTYGSKEETLIEKRAGIGKLVIIPFEDKMYMSDADAPIGKETGLKPGEIMTKFRNSLIESMEIEMRRDWDIQVFYEEMKLNETFGLDYVHAGIRYQYVEIPEDVLIANDTTIEKKDLKNNKKQSKSQSGISGGEVVTYSDNREKYMTLIVENDTLLSFIDSSLKSDYYLFINEFDIRHFVTDPDRITSGGLQYRLKVHFNCLDEKEKTLVSGAVTANVPANTKNVYEIIQQGMPEISKKLAKMLRKAGVQLSE